MMNDYVVAIQFVLNDCECLMQVGTDFLRVGTKGHVHPDVLPFVCDELTKNVTTVSELELLYNSKVFTTVYTTVYTIV